MRILRFLLLACSAPAIAQHQGHDMPAVPEADGPSGHESHEAHAPAEQPPADPHAAHATPDPHAGHAPPDPHAGHSASGEAAPPTAPPPPEASTGPAHAADAVYGTGAMEAARAQLRVEHGGMKHYKIMLDRLEWSPRDGGDGFAWEGGAWYGGDIDKAWLKTEGEGRFGGGVEAAEVQALWSRAVSPWFDLQLGLRHDFRPQPQRTHLVLGVQGLAPYWFEVGAAAFVSDKGDVTARIEAEYDLRLTQRLTLQPSAELEFALQDVPETGVGSGFSSAELGLRLRYEIEPEFAPYVGLEHERAFGDTARFQRAGGEEARDLRLLVGLRAWF
jgi:copper resistance protein B